jgi:hypothetical protein
MHSKAAMWDREFVVLSGKGARSNQPLPGRPCDYCGEPVSEAGIYIHLLCLLREREEICENLGHSKAAESTT